MADNLSSVGKLLAPVRDNDSLYVITLSGLSHHRRCKRPLSRVLLAGEGARANAGYRDRATLSLGSCGMLRLEPNIIGEPSIMYIMPNPG